MILSLMHLIARNKKKKKKLENYDNNEKKKIELFKRLWVIVVRLKIRTSLNSRAIVFRQPVFCTRARAKEKLRLQVISGSVFRKNGEQLATGSPYVVAVLPKREKERDTKRERERGGEKGGLGAQRRIRWRGKKEKQNKIRTVSYAPACMINVAI